jgi:hypothetical protein
MNKKQSHQVQKRTENSILIHAIINKNSMSDGPVFKKIIRDVSNVPLTRERLIGAQREDQVQSQSQMRRKRMFLFAI